MFCTQCGQEAQAGEKFCARCGSKLRSDLIPEQLEQKEKCRVEFRTTGERWGLFPRDVGEFQAFSMAGSQVIPIGGPVKIELESCSFDGPKKTTKQHVKALEKLTEALCRDGWQLSREQGPEWYQLIFFR